MKAVILAAGIASRLRPLTDTTPKCLLKVGERCLLQRAFDALLQNGFREFVIVTGYRQQQIVNFLEAHYPALEVTFIYNEKYASTNNIYSLWLTRPYVDKEDILLLDSYWRVYWHREDVCRLYRSAFPGIGGYDYQRRFG